MTAREDDVRRAKALRYSNALVTHLGPGSAAGLSRRDLADHLDGWSDIEWAKAARLFKDRLPSETTRRMIVEAVRFELTDPFRLLADAASN